MLSLPVGAPGVYINEVTGPATIAGVGTGTAAFIGPAFNGPIDPPVKVTNFDQFKRIYGQDSVDHFPYLTGVSRRYYMAYGVSGFFENGGQEAVILRVGTAVAATLNVANRHTVNGQPELAFVIKSKDAGLAGNQIRAQVFDSPPVGLTRVVLSLTGSLTGFQFDLPTATATPTTPFIPGDLVSFTATQGGAKIVEVRVMRVEQSGRTVILDKSLTPPGAGATAIPGALAHMPVEATTTQIRVSASPPQLLPGTLVRLTFQPPAPQGGGAAPAAKTALAYVDTITPAGLLRLQGIAQPSAPILPTDPFVSAEVIGFNIAITGVANPEQADFLSLSPLSSKYVFRQAFSAVEIQPPARTPTANTIALAQPQDAAAASALTSGANDNPALLRAADYEDALYTLKSVDGINLVCIPDAAFAPDAAVIEKAIVDHCVGCRDRFAILDVPDRAEPLTHRPLVTANSGFAALYYPHLLVEEQLTTDIRRLRSPQIIAIPPSGHVAGVYARVDAEGVHVAPANKDVRGVLGVAVSIANDEQAPLNRAGIDVLRVFADDGRVLVWGARTTAPADQTDWLYVNVRRLLTFIELSLDRSLRWAVFRPNDRSLWTSLQVTISEFLRKQWRQGALVGASEAQAFRVRIDDGLNPPSEMALGKLNIEIRVAPSRPAEFIIVNIGLSQQGTEISEGI